MSGEGRYVPTLKIAVVIPCFKAKAHVLDVLSEVPGFVAGIYCVDDACPDGTGALIEAECQDSRVRILYNKVNKGVGGAVKAGYQAAQADGFDIAVKIDSDGQMDPRLIPLFIAPIEHGQCDYTKGNRFYRIEDVRAMPRRRQFGNAVLSFMSKFSTGYWNVFDPTNGYTAIHLGVLDAVVPRKVADRYFFETDLLFRLNVARCVVQDVPMTAVYGDEKSGISITRIVGPLLYGHTRNFIKRIFYNYFLRDFHVASLQILGGPLMLIGGIVFSAYHWWLSSYYGIVATSGTVMIGGILIIIGMQLVLAALSYDMANLPDRPLHRTLGLTDTTAMFGDRARRLEAGGHAAVDRDLGAGDE